MDGIITLQRCWRHNVFGLSVHVSVHDKPLKCCGFR